MTGLGDVAYTGPPDASESTTSPTTEHAIGIYIGASDVTLDGLTITGNSDRSCQFGVLIYADYSPLTNIKVTNCVIRHVYHDGKWVNGLYLYGYSDSISDTEISYNEIRDLKNAGGKTIGLRSDGSYGKSISASFHDIAILNLVADKPG